MDAPNPLRVAWSMLRSRRVSRPGPFASGTVDHQGLAPVLAELADRGIAAVANIRVDLRRYLDQLGSIDPAGLTRDEALAFWLNLYNAAALDLAGRAAAEGAATVLGLPGAFDADRLAIAGEMLSLDAIEHGKVRRFGDPRIHGALVCGSVSCPTLRYEAYRGDVLGSQLDDQMRRFLAGGGLIIDGRTALLSRVFLWFGGDFTRPQRMPTWLPPIRRAALLEALRPWMDGDTSRWVQNSRPAVEFQPYDWGLRCAVG